MLVDTALLQLPSQEDSQAKIDVVLLFDEKVRVGDGGDGSPPISEKHELYPPIKTP